jgi:DoxX-like family
MTTLTVTSESAFPRKASLYVGRVLSGLAAGFLGFDAVMKLTDLFDVPPTAAPLGAPEFFARPLGLAELICIALYLIPRTANLGALAMTILFAGSLASRVAAAEPIGAHLVLGVYLAVLVWGGLGLRRRAPLSV